jgi:hypothetical protein
MNTSFLEDVSVSNILTVCTPNIYSAMRLYVIIFILFKLCMLLRSFRAVIFYQASMLLIVNNQRNK